MEQGNRPIPNRLLMHRKLMQYTQAQVARLLDLHDTNPITEWEKGITIPNTANLAKLSAIYRTYPNELYQEYYAEVRRRIQQKEQALFVCE